MVNGGYGKNPALAAIGSFFVPGLGQVYNGDGFRRGLMYLAGTLIGCLLLIIPGLIVWLYGIYNAYATAKKVNAGVLPCRNVDAGTMIVYAAAALAAIYVWYLVLSTLLAVMIIVYYL